MARQVARAIDSVVAPTKAFPPQNKQWISGGLLNSIQVLVYSSLPGNGSIQTQPLARVSWAIAVSSRNFPLMQEDAQHRLQQARVFRVYSPPTSFAKPGTRWAFEDKFLTKVPEDLLYAAKVGHIGSSSDAQAVHGQIADLIRLKSSVPAVGASEDSRTWAEQTVRLLQSAGHVKDTDVTELFRQIKRWAVGRISNPQVKSLGYFEPRLAKSDAQSAQEVKGEHPA